jgi:hypothetical protein
MSVETLELQPLTISELAAMLHQSTTSARRLSDVDKVVGADKAFRACLPVRPSHVLTTLHGSGTMGPTFCHT